MSKEEVKGIKKQIHGEIRDQVGKLTNDREEQVKGKIEKVQGKTQEAIGKAKRKSEE
jgi:uncharacterized protein YjbJ (UPF0337 family)